MKKTFKILITLLFCLCPVLLAACGGTDYYTITTAPSSGTLGRVESTNQTSFAEGTTVTLNAKENDATTNPLLCWVKDNEYLVKVAKVSDGVLDTKLELTSSAETEGKYTAVFYEEAQSMMYAYVNPIISTEGLPTEGFESKITLSYALMSAGSNNYLPYEYKADEGSKPNILYFGGLGINNEFKFKLDLELSSKESKETHTMTSDTIISKNNVEDIEYTCSLQSGATVKFTISISKLDKNISALFNI